MKLLLPKRRLKPRTFRAAEGQTVFVGGVLRMDVLRCPGATMYLTVWASDDLVCHFGKTEGADDRCLALCTPHRVLLTGLGHKRLHCDMITGVSLSRTTA